MVNPDKIIGAVHGSEQHDSASKHVTGKAQYIDDMAKFPNTLEIVIVTSPYAHAKIRSIDTFEASRVDGVVVVLTAKDIPGTNDIAPVWKRLTISDIGSTFLISIDFLSELNASKSRNLVGGLEYASSVNSLYSA